MTPGISPGMGTGMTSSGKSQNPVLLGNSAWYMHLLA